MSLLSVKMIGLQLPWEVRGFLCKCPRQKCTYPRVTWMRSPPFQPKDGLMMLKARNASPAWEENITACFHFPSTGRQPKTALSAVHSPQPKRAIHVPDRLNTRGIWYDHSWEGFFPLLSNPVKPGLAKAVELREWLNAQSPWRLENSLSTRGRHFAFGLSGFLISTADY